MARASLTRKRLLGIDRSGPAPPATRAGEPLRPWTLPNAIGFARIALIPVFLVVALDSRDGHSLVAAGIFAAIGATDYLDGIAARVTGQYSRLGTLLDPLTDRLLVISGVVVNWSFDLLPRWALALLAARELVMLILSRVAMRQGVELQVRQLGRYAVWPTMFSLFLAIVTRTWVANALLFIGLAMTLLATAQYIRDGRRQAARLRADGA
ncbi:MAG: CDP-diacylglycerol--glycerol-3-phosphate 3-phosphatidyltransferase [Thermoleophilaceae bacterium]